MTAAGLFDLQQKPSHNISNKTRQPRKCPVLSAMDPIHLLVPHQTDRKAAPAHRILDRGNKTAQAAAALAVSSQPANSRRLAYNKCLLSRICGVILAPGVVPSCDTGQFP